MINLYKLIIPLISDDITKKDLLKKNGFVTAYEEDKNRPYIENCIFLMYDLSIRNENTYDREQRFKSSPNLYNKRIIQYKGKRYMLYAFKYTNNEAKFLIDDRNPIIVSKKNIYKILKFWKGNDSVLRHIILEEEWSKECVQYVPEEDYSPSFAEAIRAA